MTFSAAEQTAGAAAAAHTNARRVNPSSRTYHPGTARMVDASFYLADCKNRSRVAWTIAVLVFATPVLVVLLLVPALPLGSLSILERGDKDFR